MPTPAGPGTNEFRCDACGRWFNTESELASHQFECVMAKQTTEAGRRDLETQQHQDHQKNDHDSTEHPFQHGTGHPGKVKQ
jgi:hypothetical protein